jgi:hypothetical protein
MTYRVCYEDGWTPARDEVLTQITEYFYTEHEALRRTRELVQASVHHGVTLIDHSGNTLSGVHLESKLSGIK